jgi:hypothetical protein
LASAFWIACTALTRESTGTFSSLTCWPSEYSVYRESLLIVLIARAGPSHPKFLFFSLRARWSPRKISPLVNGPGRQTSHVLHIAFKRRAVGHRKNSVVPYFPTLGDLQNFEHADWSAAQSTSSAFVDGVNPQSLG